MELNYFQVSRKYNSVITAILAGCKWSKRQRWFTTEWVSHPGHPPQTSPTARTDFAEDWPKSKNHRCSKHLADGDKDLKPYEYWHVGISVRYQLSRPSFWGAWVSLFPALTERFDFPMSSVPSTCGVMLLAMPSTEPGPGWRHRAPNPSAYPRGKHLSLPEHGGISLLRHPKCRKLCAGIPSSPVPRDRGAEMPGWAGQTESSRAEPAPQAQLQSPRAARPSPRWAISQDVFGAQFLQDIFLLAENRAHTKLNEAKAYHLYTLQKRHHHHCQMKTWKTSRRQNNLCSHHAALKALHSADSRNGFDNAAREIYVMGQHFQFSILHPHIFHNN